MSETDDECRNTTDISIQMVRAGGVASESGTETFRADETPEQPPFDPPAADERW